MSTRMYRTMNEDHFPERMEITFDNEGTRQTLVYERATWSIDGERRGLRYGENPDQQASLYRLVNGNLNIGGVTLIAPGRHLASNVELLQSGKHPGKINITDTDSALNILRYFHEKPATVIIKHNNPCGVALGTTLEESYQKAYRADRIAAFGGVVAVNRELDLVTAEQIAESYSEVVVAPEFASGVVEALSSRANLRIMRITTIERLHEFVGQSVLEFRSLIDGGLVLQWSQTPQIGDELFRTPATTTRKGVRSEIGRAPTDSEARDMRFGWLVEFGVTSNSVLYVRDETTVGIGTGEQDRVGVAEIARDKAYRKHADRLAWDLGQTPFNALTDPDARAEIWTRTEREHGGIPGSAMISDAFFPFRDGVEVGLKEGVTSVVQPGGGIRDDEVISACNEANATMVFTGQRSFRH